MNGENCQSTEGEDVVEAGKGKSSRFCTRPSGRIEDLRAVVDTAMSRKQLSAVVDTAMSRKQLKTHYLWPPCVADADIIFCPVVSSIFLSSPNLSGRTVDVYHTCTHGVALVQI